MKEVSSLQKEQLLIQQMDLELQMFTKTFFLSSVDEE